MNIKNVFDTAKQAVKNTQDVLDKCKTGLKIKEIENRILEHKYNIGKMIYDNEINIEEGLITSNVNSIDRLLEEIEKIGGKYNG